ncbi:hypothetical protein BDZ97DRAFT_1842168 [Flammula alnicola]|nr:hypothetical protein BDZ97DRAFT_1842168 [Flammula alnicola]
MGTGFSTKSYVFDPRPSYPLLSVVKRYWKPQSAYLNDPEALTLIFAHATGFHKEQWEPVIDDLQAIIDKGAGKTKIREIWTIDAPNHGDSAELNEETLKLGYGRFVLCRSIHLFLSGLGSGVDVDFTGHKLVAIGHSMGAALSMGYYPKINFTSFILCEVMIMSAKFGIAAANMLVQGAEKRRDIWPSKEEAYKLLKARGTWKAAEIKTDVVENLAGGLQNLASFTRVQGAGHLYVVQMNPTGLSEKIYNALVLTSQVKL